MKVNRRTGGFRAVAGRCILLSWLFLTAGGAVAQGNQAAATDSQQRSAHAALPAEGTVPVLFLSDIHFEPFFDPGKVKQLAGVPVNEWKAILAAAPSADREQHFRSLEQTCHVRGDDTSPALLESSLLAMRKEAAGAKFVLVSGDLMAHAFSCKYGAVFPHAAAGDYRAFVEKTLNYVMGELSSSFPGVPVFVGLGNNDTDCDDYRLDAHSDFLAAAGGEVTKGFPLQERQGALETFAAGGYYSVALPAPVRNARLLVLNDLFMSSIYATCAGKADSRAADEQLAWLEQQLSEARRNKEKIWVMGHIPPGVDVHATAMKMGDVCGGQGTVMFLASEKMADELVEFSDVVELAIYAHTHMDEMRILKAEIEAQGSAPGKSVAVKMVPSISPINGNAPSFTVARIVASSAALEDYRVFSASNATGVDAAWHEEYDFGRTYHEAGFSASSVNKLIAGFQADPGARTEASRDYIRNFSAGNASLLLGLVWQQYVCSLSNYSAQAFRSCVCPAGK